MAPSAISCDICEAGYLLPQTAINQYKCDKCLATLDSKACENSLAELESLAKKAAKTLNFEICQNAAETLRLKLHPNHCIIVSLEEKMMRLNNTEQGNISINHVNQERSQTPHFQVFYCQKSETQTCIFCDRAPNREF